MHMRTQVYITHILCIYLIIYIYINLILDGYILVVMEFKFLIKPWPKIVPLISLRHSLQEKK